ncbi:Esterase 6 [Gryllus bimaculatus]|nr:Esterase 6 [Gryllus bimaculatus]
MSLVHRACYGVPHSSPGIMFSEQLQQPGPRRFTPTGTMKALLLAVALSCALAAAAGAATVSRGDGPPVEVEIPGVGKLVGKESTTTRLSYPIYKFLGIPFVAKPERFQPPTEFARWNGARDVRNPARGCPDLTEALSGFLPLDSFYPGATAFAAAAKKAAAGRATARDDDVDDDKEDCLTLDIYTHNLNPEKLAPVFFYIHGGAFVLGSSQMANGDFLLEHGDMVLVSVQYRLGPMGFLQASEADAPGNAALHDLHWALKWPRVSRSATVLYAGLLAGTALFSGGALVPWTVDADPWRSTRGVGVFAGCLRPDNLAECLRTRSTSALQRAWGIWTIPKETTFDEEVDFQWPDAFISTVNMITKNRDSFSGMRGK